MSTQNVLEALKQKLLQEQAQNNSPQQSASKGSPGKPSSADPYSRRSDDRSRDVPDRTSYLKRDDRPSSDRAYPSTSNEKSDARANDSRSTYSRSNRDSRDFGGYRRNGYGSNNREGYERNDNHDRRGGERRDNGGRDYGGRDYGGRDYGGRDYGGRDRRDYRDNRSQYRDDRYERGSRYRERDTRGVSRYDNEDSQDGYSRNSYEPEDLTNVVPIDKLPRKSLWDIKPKGFEKVSSERAKISGLFPLPGETRKRVDITKLQGLVSGGDLNSQTSILFEEISIDTLSSRNSKQLIITGVEFTLFPVQRLLDYITNYINSLELDNAFIVSHELLELKYLTLNLSNSNLATILFASSSFFQKELNLKIKIERPQSYITPIGASNNSESSVKVPDSDKKIAITSIPLDINEQEISQDLEEIGEISKLELLSDKDGQSKGIAFVEFKAVAVEDAIKAIDSIVIGEITLKSFLSCKGLPKQAEEFTYRTISTIAQSHKITESNVLILLNVIPPEDLKNEVIYQEVQKDIREECEKYGKVLDIKIPKPSEDYKRNLKSIDTSVGKIFVKFENDQGAKRASKLLNGRKYNERTVLVSFLNEADFNINLF